MTKIAELKKQSIKIFAELSFLRLKWGYITYGLTDISKVNSLTVGLKVSFFGQHVQSINRILKMSSDLDYILMEAIWKHTLSNRRKSKL